MKLAKLDVRLRISWNCFNNSNFILRYLPVTNESLSKDINASKCYDTTVVYQNAVLEIRRVMPKLIFARWHANYGPNHDQNDHNSKSLLTVVKTIREPVTRVWCTLDNDDKLPMCFDTICHTLRRTKVTRFTFVDTLKMRFTSFVLILLVGRWSGDDGHHLNVLPKDNVKCI